MFKKTFKFRAFHQIQSHSIQKAKGKGGINKISTRDHESISTFKGCLKDEQIKHCGSRVLEGLSLSLYLQHASLTSLIYSMQRLKGTLKESINGAIALQLSSTFRVVFRSSSLNSSVRITSIYPS